jgi:hypothetical protein
MKSKLLLYVFPVFILIAGCTSDDNNTTAPPPPVNPLVGNWYSEAEDVATLLKFPPVSAAAISAEFRANNTYEVKSFQANGTTTVFSGTWSATLSSVGQIYTIRLEQSMPSALTSEGMFEVNAANPDSLRYEVIQTVPSLPGFTIPTPTGGFGSTGGLTPGINVQRYKRISPNLLPVVGSWVSKGQDVAILLSSAPANFDSISARFNINNTYTVSARQTTGSILNFSGTYTSQESNVANIFTIRLEQTAPTALTSEGILRVFPNFPDSMYYEVVQTTPTLTGVTPPTPTGGFGSTSNGAFGNTNRQVYRRLRRF